MKAVVVGAAGQLGSALVAEIERAGWHAIALTRASLDVTSSEAEEKVADLSPDVIVNASAWNDVDGAESDPAPALCVNRDAVARLARAARKTGAALVHYSTDFVFDGRAVTPYVETMPASPLNKYGESKLAGEHEASGAPEFFVLRLASVFGGRLGQGAGGRSTIDRMIDALLADCPVRAFVDRTVSPSYTVDVARATMQLIVNRPGSGVYHCTNSGFTTWYALARQMAATLGVAASVVPIACDAVRLGAARPRFCALSNGKLASKGIVMPTWQDALIRHLSTRVSFESRAHPAGTRPTGPRV
jgi:dTDP-4-dehydrorhamnose reductase